MISKIAYIANQMLSVYYVLSQQQQLYFLMLDVILHQLMHLYVISQTVSDVHHLYIVHNVLKDTLLNLMEPAYKIPVIKIVFYVI